MILAILNLPDSGRYFCIAGPKHFLRVEAAIVCPFFQLHSTGGNGSTTVGSLLNLLSDSSAIDPTKGHSDIRLAVINSIR